MAATQADLSRLDAILKDRPLLDSLQEAFNKATPMAEKITQQLTLSGRQGIFSTSFGANEGIFSRPDKGTFGDSQVDKPALAKVTAKYVYALFEISGPTMSATRDSTGAFEDALALNLEKTITGVKLDMARLVLNADSNGVIALVQSKTDTTNDVLDSPFGLTTYKSNRPVRNILRKGMAVDVIDTVAPPATKHHSNHGITAVVHSSAGTTITLDTAEATAPADGDFVARAGSYGYEPQGFFAGVATTGTYLNIARSGNDGWQGVVVDGADGGAATVDLDPDMLRDTIDTIMETSGRSPTHIVANYKARRNIYNLFAPQIRYAPMSLPAGMTEATLSFDGIPVIAERFFPPEHIGFLDVNTWYHAIDKDVEWIQGQNGSVLHFAISSDLWTAVLRTYRDLVCLFPAANGYLYGITE